MNIQNNTINFKANRCLTSQKIIKSGKNEVVNTVDIFRLNHTEDDKFAKFCINALDNPPTDKRYTLFKKFENFFKDFLQTRISDNDYYLAIKDGCEITGFAKVTQSFNSSRETLVKKLFATNDNLQSEQALYRAISKQAEDDLSTHIIGRNLNLKLHKFQKEETNPNITNQKSNEKFDLFKFLNIDFENRIL